MSTNSKIIYPQLSYHLVGLCFDTHNALDRYAREKQYADYLEKLLQEDGINYRRETTIGDSGNRLDFLVKDKIILELKAKGRLTKKDYYQVQNYLQSSRVKLGLLINFRRKNLSPKRIVRIDKDA